MSLFTAIRDTLSGFKSLLIGMRITAREAAKPILTVQYPRETLKMPARFRGHIQLTLDPETGKPRCTACTLCEKACPSECIDLDGLRREGDKKKSVSKYMLDFTKCSLCGSCVEVCPSDAIEFSKQYNVVSLDRDQFAQMDLYAKVEAEAKAWAAAHPTPPTASAEPPSAPPTTPPPVVAERVSVSPSPASTTASATQPVATPAPKTS